MSSNPHSPKTSQVKLGLWITGGYILLGGIAAAFYYGHASTPALKLNELGDFLAGFLSPVAFLWLIFGYFQNNHAISIQAEELNLQTEELKNSIEEMKAANETSQHQLSSIQRTEALNKRDLFFRYYEVHTKDMDALAKVICCELFPYEFSEAIGKYHNGHFQVSMNDINYLMVRVAKLVSTSDDIRHQISDRSRTSPIRAEAEAYLGAFLTLQEHAENLDSSNEIKQAISVSSYGDFFKVCKKIVGAFDEINS